jgi:hypothetical protein
MHRSTGQKEIAIDDRLHEDMIGVDYNQVSTLIDWASNICYSGFDLCYVYLVSSDVMLSIRSQRNGIYVLLTNFRVSKMALCSMFFRRITQHTTPITDVSFS